MKKSNNKSNNISKIAQDNSNKLNDVIIEAVDCLLEGDISYCYMKRIIADEIARAIQNACNEQKIEIKNLIQID